MENKLVEIDNLSFAYNGQTVLENIHWEIIQGDFIAMIGPNGGGKTTLLKLILGLLNPTQGTIRVLGGPAHKSSRQIGYVPQNVHLNSRFPISVLDVVRMGTLDPHRRFGFLKRRDDRNALEALNRLGMLEYAGKRIGELSGGQRQRVFIARALVTRPELLLLDEPTANIDTHGQSEFYRLLDQLNGQVAIVVVSHDLLAISTHIKSVACVNKHLHYHHHPELTTQMIESMYPCAEDQICPVELLAHGFPHRVLRKH